MTTYLVTCSFSLKNGSVDDYRHAYADLLAVGLRKVVVSEQGAPIVAPGTTTIGQFRGSNAGEIRSHVRDRVTELFAARGLVSEILVVVGTDWAWGSGRTEPVSSQTETVS